MAIDPFTAINAGSQVLGLFSGKGKGRGNATSRATERSLRDMIALGERYDPVAESEVAIQQAIKDAEIAMQNATGSVLGGFAAQGSHGWLPDTARQSGIRGAVSTIGEALARVLADIRSSATERKMRMRAIPVGLATAGRGEQLPSNNNYNPLGGVQAFGDMLRQAFGAPSLGLQSAPSSAHGGGNVQTGGF